MPCLQGTELQGLYFIVFFLGGGGLVDLLTYHFYSCLFHKVGMSGADGTPTTAKLQGNYFNGR